jgi:hypothetical protein
LLIEGEGNSWSPSFDVTVMLLTDHCGSLREFVGCPNLG